jgi:hypothetical protein
MKVVRVTEDEFELDVGTIQPMKLDSYMMKLVPV